MPKHKESHSQEVEETNRRKKTPRQHEGKVMRAPGEEIASHGPTVEDPVALLTSPEMGHPANAPLRAQAMAELQRQRGNTYVQRLIRSGAIQAKLTVSPPDDVYEREADRVAEEVMRVPEPQLGRQVEPEEEEEEILRAKPLTGQAAPLAQRQVEPEEEEEEILRTKPLTGQAAPLAQRQVEPEEEEEEVLRAKPLTGQATPLAQRQVEPEEEEEEVLRTKPLTGQAAPLAQRQVEPEEEEEPIEMKRITGGTPEVTPDLEARLQGQKGGGQALDSKVRDQMESAFGADLSGVRVHTDAEADSLAKDLGARAFTTGKDVFFRDGSYQPGSEAGQKLIGHELAHVVQQEGDGDVRQKPRPALVKNAARGGEAEAVAPRPSSSHPGEEEYLVLGMRLTDQQPLIARQRERGPLEAEQKLFKEIRTGLKYAGVQLEKATKLLEAGQRLSNRDLGQAVRVLNKVSGGIGKVASAAGKAEGVLGLTNTIAHFDKAWDEYFADPSEANLEKLQKHLDATMGAFENSAGLLGNLVPGLGSIVSALIKCGRAVVRAVPEAIAKKHRQIQAIDKPPGKRRGPAPTERPPPEGRARPMPEWWRELHRAVKPRQVGADVERVFSRWRRAKRLTSIPRPIVTALDDFKTFYRGAMDGLDKLEGLSWHEKMFTEKDKVYKDKIRWGSTWAIDALDKLEEEMYKIDIWRPNFHPDSEALRILKDKHAKKK